MEKGKTRREVLRLIAVGTLLFALLLALGLWIAKETPAWREQRLQSALEAGDTRRARRLAERAGAEEALDRCDWLDAGELMAEGRWEEAAALLTALGDYADAPEKLSECRYQAALAKMERGETGEAAELFRALGSYRDAAEQLRECRYREAAALEERGETAQAALLFASLEAYRDARERAETLAVSLTGLRDAEAALAQLSGLSPEALAHRQALAEARSALPTGCVAAGFYHTLGCRNDGKVLACGDDAYGQCRTEDWTEITAVAAGAYHSLGLRSDGTVVAAGRNEEGQCEVSAWRGVVAIAAGDYVSYGLCADGTLLCAGLGDHTAARSWSGVTAIAAGAYELGALLSDGSVRLAPDALDTEGMTELVALAVNTGCAVGIRSDGTAVSPQLDLGGWNDMLALSLSGTRLLGLDAQGGVKCLSFRASDALALEEVGGAVALADGGTHTAVVFSDGSVRVYGETDRGQGETASWRLFG